MSARPRVDRALIVDFERTCWDGEIPEGETPEIIEIGLVEVDICNLLILRESRTLVRPLYSRVSEFCTSLTGLDASDLRRHGKPYHEVARTLRKEFGSQSKPWFAWGRDDADIETQPGPETVHPFGGPFVDLSLLFGMAFPDQHRTGLAGACSHLGITWRGAPHRALDDARMTAEVLFELLRRSRR